MIAANSRANRETSSGGHPAASSDSARWWRRRGPAAPPVPGVALRCDAGRARRNPRQMRVMATQQRRGVQTVMLDHRSTDRLRIERGEWSRLGGAGSATTGPARARSSPRNRVEPSTQPPNASRNGEAGGCTRPASTNLRYADAGSDPRAHPARPSRARRTPPKGGAGSAAGSPDNSTTPSARDARPGQHAPG